MHPRTELFEIIANQDDRIPAAARELAQTDAVESALHFAERRRLGPFAIEAADRKSRERALAAMIRAGHSFGLARAILDLAPGAEFDPADLAESSG